MLTTKSGKIKTFLVATGATIVISSILGEPIKRTVDEVIKWSSSKYNDMCYLTLTIDLAQNPKSVYAILQEMIKKKVYTASRAINDGHTDPFYNYPEGVYIIQNTAVGDVTVSLGKENLVLWINKYKNWTFDTHTQADFLEWFTQLYNTYNNKDAVTVFFTSEGSKWSFPIFRQPRVYNITKLTTSMNSVIADVDNFIAQEQDYKNLGIPYRRGYLLYGLPGTGKTTLIEIIAKRHGMSVYLLNLNAYDMTDTVLFNLISLVPPHSILVIEEIDRQIKTLQTNINNRVSIGGLLSALDGPLRLNNQSIAILTANCDNFLEPGDRAALLRRGRIDQVVKLTEVVDVYC